MSGSVFDNIGLSVVSLLENHPQISSVDVAERPGYVERSLS
jgi:hypothetical protein